MVRKSFSKFEFLAFNFWFYVLNNPAIRFLYLHKSVITPNQNFKIFQRISQCSLWFNFNNTNNNFREGR